MASIDEYFRAQADPRIPTDERRDVNRELVKELISGVSRSDYIPQSEMQQWMADYSAAEQQNTIAKAQIFNSSWYSQAVVRKDGHRSILRVNDLGIVGAGPVEKWEEKPVQGGLEFLRYMGDQLDIHQAVIYTRDKQVKPFTRRYRDDDQVPVGYDWVRVDGEKLSDADRKKCLELDKILQNSGTEFDPQKRDFDYDRRSLTGFITALLADSLTADFCPIETELTVGGKLAGWYNIPFDTVRLARESGYLGDDRIVAVQVIQNQGIVGLERDDFVSVVRNPRSQLEFHNYGRSELENFVRMMTSYINTCTFNAANLDRNSLPRGFLTLYGRFDRRALNHFNNQWSALMRGAAKRFGMPVLVSESRQEGGAAWTPVDTSSAEMMMTKWLVFICSLYAAAHGMAPEELNMESFSAKSSSLSGKDTEERLQASHDKGLVSIIKYIFEDIINARLVSRLTEDFRITPVGLYPDNEDQRHERQKISMTVDEIRAIDGVDPMEDEEIGKLPINPSLIPFATQKIMMEKQQQMMGQQGGQGGEDGGGFGLPGSESPLPYAKEGEDEGQQQPGGGAPGGAQPPGGAGRGNVVPFQRGGGGGGGGAPAIAKAAIGRALKVEIRDLRGRLYFEEDDHAQGR